MVKQAEFYIIDKTESSDQLTAVEWLACELAAKAWRLGKRILIACDSENQALKLDEALWQRDPDQFVPHNLAGELTKYPAPIELAWPAKRNAQRRDLLINLQAEAPDFIASFNQIIDFVPSDEALKEQARQRYQHYRQQGWKLSTQQA